MHFGALRKSTRTRQAYDLVCANGLIHERRNGWIDGRRDGRVDGLVGWMDGSMGELSSS